MRMNIDNECDQNELLYFINYIETEKLPFINTLILHYLNKQWPMTVIVYLIKDEWIESVITHQDVSCQSLASWLIMSQSWIWVWCMFGHAKYVTWLYLPMTVLLWWTWFWIHLDSVSVNKHQPRNILQQLYKIMQDMRHLTWNVLFQMATHVPSIKSV